MVRGGEGMNGREERGEVWGSDWLIGELIVIGVVVEGERARGEVSGNVGVMECG